MTDDQLPFDINPTDPAELMDAERAQAKRDPSYVLRDDMKGLQWVRRWREQLHATQVLVRGQRFLSPDCEKACQRACAYPGLFSECDIGTLAGW
jgi:hypothetical protein